MVSADSSVASSGSLDDEIEDCGPIKSKKKDDHHIKKEAIVSTSSKISHYSGYETPISIGGIGRGYRRDSDTSSQHSQVTANSNSGAGCISAKRRFHSSNAGIGDGPPPYYSNYYNKQQPQNMQSPNHSQPTHHQPQEYYGNIEFAAADSPHLNHRLHSQQIQNIVPSPSNSGGDYLSPKPDYIVSAHNSPQNKIVGNEMGNKIQHGPAVFNHPPPVAANSGHPAQQIHQPFYNQQTSDGQIPPYNGNTVYNNQISHHGSYGPNQPHIPNEFEGNYYEPPKTPSGGGYYEHSIGFQQSNDFQPNGEFQTHQHAGILHHFKGKKS